VVHVFECTPPAAVPHAVGHPPHRRGAGGTRRTRGRGRRIMATMTRPSGPTGPLSGVLPARRLALAVLSMAVGAFAIGVTEFATMGLLPQIAETFDAPLHQASHLIAAYAVGVVVGAPVIMLALPRQPRTGLLIGLAGALALGNAFSALAPTLGPSSSPGCWPGYRTGPTSGSPRWWPRPSPRPSAGPGRSHWSWSASPWRRWSGCRCPPPWASSWAGGRCTGWSPSSRW